MIQLEEVPILTIVKKNCKVTVIHSADANDYEILGILKTYTKRLEEDLIENYENI